MKQKVLYIILMISALMGRNGLVWGQGSVEGYNGPYFDVNETTASMDYDKWGKIDSETYSYYCNDFLTFRINNTNGIGQYSTGMGYRFGDFNATLSWSITTGYYLQIKYLSCKAYQTTAGANRQHSINGSAIKTGGITKSKATTAESQNLSLSNTDEVKVILGSTVSYITNISATYTISHYTLITTAIDDAKTYADGKFSNIADDLVSYLTTAKNNADTFKGECAFPNSYWNGSPVGKSPGDVAEAAAKLMAIADYLVVRTNARVYQKGNIPDAVYDLLHQYDSYDPNDFDSNTINTAKGEVEAAITMANNTTAAYLAAKTTIDKAVENNNNNSPQGIATADINTAKTQLEEAKSTAEIEEALANIKQFDLITFSETSEIVEGGSVVNPATASSGKAVTYKSSDDNVIAVEGTTLKAVGAGTATITASTETGNGYYAYEASKAYTVTPLPKELVLTDGNLPKVGEKYSAITLKRTLSGICTLTLPFTTSIGEIAPGQKEAWAAQLALVTYNKADGYTLYFRKTDGTITANQPYVVNIPVAVTNKVWERNIELTEEPSAKSVKCNVVGNNGGTMEWIMQGNYEKGLSMKGKYGIAGGKLCLGGESSFINAYTAYFENRSAQQNVQTRVAILNEQGDATHIGEVKGGVLMVTTSVNSPDSVQHKQSRKSINIVRTKDGAARKILK